MNSSVAGTRKLDEETVFVQVLRLDVDFGRLGYRIELPILLASDEITSLCTGFDLELDKSRQALNDQLGPVIEAYLYSFKIENHSTCRLHLWTKSVHLEAFGLVYGLDTGGHGDGFEYVLYITRIEWIVVGQQKYRCLVYGTRLEY